jgi:hypothetical protein
VHAIRPLSIDIDEYLEDAVRAKNQLDAERWRAELRPRAVREFAARATKLQWSRALLKATIEELYPDDLFVEIIGDLDRVPRRLWPQVLAVAIALRHSWRREGLARITSRLRLSLTRSRRSQRHPRPSFARFSGSPRARQGAPLRFARATRGLAALTGTRSSHRGHLRDGRAHLRTVHERRP